MFVLTHGAGAGGTHWSLEASQQGPQEREVAHYSRVRTGTCGTQWATLKTSGNNGCAAVLHGDEGWVVKALIE